MVVSTHRPSSAASRDERLRVDRAGEMDVQVGALWEIAEKSAEGFRPLVQIGLVDEAARASGSGGYALGVGLDTPNSPDPSGPRSAAGEAMRAPRLRCFRREEERGGGA